MQTVKSNQSPRNQGITKSNIITFEQKVSLQEEGILQDYVPNRFKLRLSDANLASDNRIVVILDDGEQIGRIVCSKNLSTQIRSALQNGFQKKQILAKLLKMPIAINSQGIPFIITEGSESFSLSELKSIDLTEVPF